MEIKLSIEDIVNRDEIPLVETLECPIDSMISLTPVICKKCETVYCTDCINSWKKKSSECPMRCKPIELIECDKTIFKQQIDLIRVLCPNKEFGCFEKVLYREKLLHEKKCLYIPFKCDKCELKMATNSYISHLTESCDKSKLMCIYCSNHFNILFLSKHIEICFKNNLNSFCETCMKIHKIKEECSLKVEDCEKCKMPDLKFDLINKIHKCCYENSADKVNLYLRNIHNKISSATQEFSRQYILNYNNLINKYHDFAAEINKKLDDYIISLERKKLNYHDDPLKKFISVKIEKKANILLIDKELEEVKNKIECI